MAIPVFTCKLCVRERRFAVRRAREAEAIVKIGASRNDENARSRLWDAIVCGVQKAPMDVIIGMHTGRCLMCRKTRIVILPRFFNVLWHGRKL